MCVKLRNTYLQYAKNAHHISLTTGWNSWGRRPCRAAVKRSLSSTIKLRSREESNWGSPATCSGRGAMISSCGMGGDIGCASTMLNHQLRKAKVRLTSKQWNQGVLGCCGTAKCRSAPQSVVRYRKVSFDTAKCCSIHWGQRGSYPPGKLRVFWEILNN